jgi:hypothetical protein
MTSYLRFSKCSSRSSARRGASKGSSISRSREKQGGDLHGRFGCVVMYSSTCITELIAKQKKSYNYLIRSNSIMQASAKADSKLKSISCRSNNNKMTLTLINQLYCLSNNNCRSSEQLQKTKNSMLFLHPLSARARARASAVQCSPLSEGHVAVIVMHWPQGLNLDLEDLCLLVHRGMTQ